MDHIYQIDIRDRTGAWNMYLAGNNCDFLLKEADKLFKRGHTVRVIDKATDASILILGEKNPNCSHEDDVLTALNTAQLAIDEYYNGDSAWAELWLLKAYQANEQPK